MSSSTTINPKPCNYNCGTRIYWNTAVKEYWEVFTKKKHVCPNRSKPNNNNVTQSTTTATTTPTYYNKRPFVTQPKPKMSNSFELLTGPINEIQRSMKYYLI